MNSATTLKSRAAHVAAKRRLAASSVAPVYASAFKVHRSLSISTRMRARFSPAVGSTFSGGDL